MPSEIVKHLPSGEKHVLEWILPGDTAFLSPNSLTELDETLVLVCCDNNDECTDIFVFGTPEGVVDPAEEIDLDDVCTEENFVAQIKDGDYLAMDMKKLGLSSQPAQLVMGHLCIMASN